MTDTDDSTIASDGAQLQRRVLLTRITLRIWLIVSFGVSILTVATLVAYMLSDFPDQWGFYVGAWAKNNPLRSLFFLCLAIGLLSNRILYGISPKLPGTVSVWDQQYVPEILAYHPRTVVEAVRVFFVCASVVNAMIVFYLIPLEFFLEIIGLFYKL